MDPLYLRKLRIDRQIQSTIGPQPENPQNAEQNVKQPAQPEQLKQPNITNTSEIYEEVQTPQEQATDLTRQSERIMQDMKNEMLSPKQLKMNYLASIERSSYVKKVMNLPETLPELLIQLQNPELAKDVRNILLQPVPEPDTQRTTKKEESDGSGQKNNNEPNNDEKPKIYNKPSEGFSEALKSETERKEAILRHYNNTDVSNKTDNSQQNILKGQIEIKRDIAPEKTIQNPSFEKPLPQNERLIISNNQEQIPQGGKPVSPQTQNQMPTGEKPLAPQMPNQVPATENKPIEAEIHYKPIVPNHDGVIPDKHHPPIDNRHSMHGKEHPTIHFRPIDKKIVEDINRFIVDSRVHNEPHMNERHPIRERHLPPPPKYDLGEPKPPEVKQQEAAANLYANLAMNDVNNPTLTQMRQRLSDDAIELLFTGLINLKDLAHTIKHNGHDARSKLILAMASASRHGIDNSQIASSMKQVSESMAATDNNPSSILKNIIMLYLPWYPLQEGVGFNLSIETIPGMSDMSSLLKVYIQTKNYGNVNGSLVLMSGNTVDMNIQCNDVFPKDDLLEKMKDVTDNHSIQSNITVAKFEQVQNEVNNQEAKVNLSSTYELNPFLLLMAHSFIKNTILIDSNSAPVV